jgi:hypothetical protein
MNFSGSFLAESTLLIGAALKSLRNDDMCFLIVSKIFIILLSYLNLIISIEKLKSKYNEKSPGNPRL